ncbi:uncharacterized protein Dana_GF27911 [Drosophila ananassae]|uniref:Ionotropic glutamate receptor C-terminal domain-containing protein n=1 Tax=Drosophila ananassae TaxID=7217 RepID=A0A0P8XSN6_DROAN|nr:uncharacterized protein LOC26515320 [Drosophila ananassae]KPU77718.1 uncharacterized protein Dana_GF27911 [Drosophila ananassae]
MFLILAILMTSPIGATGSFVQPIQLAQFMDRIGRVYRLTAFTVASSSDAVDLSYLDGLYRELRSNTTNHFRLLPQMTATSEEDEELKFSAIQDEETMYLVFARNHTDSIVELQAKRARGRRYCKTIFFIRDPIGGTDLAYFFDLIWRLQFRSALVVVAMRRFYQMDPYPEIRIIRMRKLASYDPLHLFPLPNRNNFKGYRLRLPVQEDIPNTFWSLYSQRTKRHLDGLGGTLITQFMAHLNVSLDLYPLLVNGSSSLDLNTLNGLIIQNKIEMSPHLYDTLHPNSQVDYSYPYLMCDRCFMIPLDNAIPRNLYVFMPFRSYLWTCFILTLLILHFFYVRRLMKSSQIWAALGLPGADRRRSSNTKLSSLLSSSLILMGIFILVQSYTTRLTSFLTVTLTQKPAGTLEEILEMPNRILVVPSDVEIIVGSLGHSEEFKRKFSFADKHTFDLKRIAMDPEFIYPISRFRWKFFNNQQQFLRKKRFILTNICQGTFPFQYQLRIDSHFKDPLHQFQLRVRESALGRLWSSTSHHNAHLMGYLKDFSTLAELEETSRIRPLSITVLCPVFTLFLCGMLGSGIAFLFEIRHSLGCKKRGKPPPTNRNPGIIFKT